MANYINRLEAEVAALKAQLKAAQNEVTEMTMYYTSSKFHGIDNDYAHVSTDVLPRLGKIRDVVNAPSILFTE